MAKKKEEAGVSHIHRQGLSYSGVEYDYETHHDCEAAGCGWICRCGKITRTWVESVNINEIVHYLCDKGLLKIDRYCVDRILTINHIYDKDLWEITTRSGYYGEEISSVWIEDAIGEKCDNEIEEILSLEDDEKLRFVLVLEYGYLLDSLQNKKFKEICIDVKDISFGQEEYYKKVCQKTIDRYKEYPLPRGIVVSDSNNRYRLIDGYNRCAAATGQIPVYLAY